MQPWQVAPVIGATFPRRSIHVAQAVERPSWDEESTSGISRDQTGKRSRSREATERARRVESGFSPLDEELALMPGSLTPTHHEHLVHLASWMPFARAAALLERLLGVQVSAATVRRLTEAAGA